MTGDGVAMHILITGAAGMIGRKLTARLAADGALNGRPIEKLTLIDVVAPQSPEKFSGNVVAAAADIADPAAVRAAVAGRPDVIFHLAGVVSGEAELDFEKGMRVNLDGSRTLFEAVRAVGTAIARGWFSPRRLQCSARRFRRRSATIFT